jgi:hypothetical protein
MPILRRGSINGGVIFMGEGSRAWAQARPTAIDAVPGAHPRGARYDGAALAVLILALAILTLPLAHLDSLAEYDLRSMLAGIVYGATTGQATAAGHHYGLAFSFGWYEILYAVVPEQWLTRPDRVARLMNALGAASGLLCALAVAVFLRRRFGALVALTATTLFCFSPMMLPLTTSGHPLVPAAALVFFSGWLLLRAAPFDDVRRYGPLCLAAWVVATVSLTVRAEVFLAFPFLWLAAATASPPRRAGFIAPALALGAAFGTFLLLQQDYVAEAGGSGSRLMRFLASFTDPARIPRGLALLGLSTGVATGLASLAALLGRRTPLPVLLLPAALALPAFLFWVPVPEPARHFFFVVLALCLAAGLWLSALARRPAHALLAAVGLVLLNQAIAEAVHRPLVAAYDWTYPRLGDRRVTERAPTGAWIPDQQAQRQVAEALREEAVALAAAAPPRLLILADQPGHLIAELIARHPDLRWMESAGNGLEYTRLTSPGRDYLLVRKNSIWPRDAVAAVLENDAWQALPVYLQPATVSRFERTPVPPERTFELPGGLAAGGVPPSERAGVGSEASQ